MVESTVEFLSKAVVDLTEEAPIRVLHVDDELDFLKTAKQILEMQGAFEVETASSVEEAMEKMKEKEFDVIVSDYIMSGKHGLQFLKELRESENNIPFIIFTGKGREIVAIRALNLGADQYVNKIGKPETVYYELAHGIRQTVKRKRATKEVWTREQRLSAIFSSSPDSVTVSDLEGKIVDCNEAAWKLTGFTSKEELLGKSSFEFIAEKDRKRALKNLKKTFEKGTIRNVKYTFLKKDGEKYTGELSASVLKDSSGNPIGFVGVARDITERRKAEERLLESEERFRSIVENSHDGIVMIDNKFMIAYANDETSHIIGYSKEEIVGHSFMKFLSEESKNLVKDRYLRRQKGERVTSTYEFKVVRKDGQERDVEIKSTVMRDSRGMMQTVAQLLDITERKKAEEKLRSSEERLKILFEFAPDAYYLNDLAGNFVDGNKAAEELTGYNRSELVRKTFLKLGLLRRRQIPKAAKLLAKNALGKPTGPDEFVLNRKDGAQASVEIRTFPVKINGQTLVLGIARDVTERKKTLEKLKILNEKLGVVGKLTRHDVRNKLSTITNNVYLARQTLTGDSKTSEYLEDVNSSCGQMERILDFTSNYEKLGVEELIYIDVEKSVEDAVSLSSDLKGVKVMSDCKGLKLLADSLLRQLFYNLIDNSLRHGERVSQIRIFYEVGKDQMRLVYEDDGVGIPKAEKETIFEKGYGKGTGYGLWLIWQMCEVYGWTIKETGKVGKGVQFTITIPKMNESGKIAYRLH